ncbi:MAG: hypothetical protein CSA32_01220 [Desulfobulbus propionicus]|nr:MAG: hypothetical protein CSA32_01220 [Desulfobulbus propionicus]
MKSAPLHLQSCHKRYTHDQDKACSPEQTVARLYQRLKGSKLDILKGVERIDNGRLDIPVYFSVCGEDARAVIGNKKQMGKGATPAQAQASACMELTERLSFFSFKDDPDNFITGDYQQMEEQGYPVLAREILLASVHDTTLSVDLFTELLEQLPMKWAWATRLADMEAVLIPFSWFYAINEFNGTSAGNTYEEAVIQGISEVVERHVCSIISQEKKQVPAIDLNSIDDPVVSGLLDKFRRCGIKVYLGDFSLNTGIPTIGALAWDPATFPEESEIVFTAGTTPGATKAVIRALTEVAQLAGDFNTGSKYVASGLPKPSCLEEVDYVIKASQKIRLQDMADLADEDIFEEVKKCTAAVKRQGKDIFVINTAHPELQIPAVYTIIPGAHFRERAAGGNAAMFAAKLAAQLLAGDALDAKLKHMQQLIPDAYYIHFYRGCHAYEQGDIEQALAFFNLAQDNSPHNEDLPYIHSYKGSCLRDLARYKEAIATLYKGLEYDEERPDIHNILGVCWFKCGHFARAVEHFGRAIALNPASAIDYANLALNLEKLGRVEEAVAQYELALGLDSSILFAQKRLALLLSQ